MHDPEPIELRFQLTVDDLRRKALFVASGSRRVVGFCDFRQVVGKLVSLGIIGLGVYILLGRVLPNVWWSIGCSYVLGLVDATLYAPFAARWRAKRTAGALSAQRWVLSPDGVDIASGDVWTHANWTSFVRVDTAGGHIFLFTDPFTTEMIPATAFAHPSQSAEAFKYIRSQVEVAMARSAIAVDSAAVPTWPPTPMAARSCAQIPPPGLMLDAAKAQATEYRVTPSERRLTSLVALRSACVYLALIWTACAIGVLLPASTHIFLWALLAVAVTAILSLGLIVARIEEREQEYRAVPPGVWRQRLTTDFTTLRIDTDETSSVYRIGALYGVATFCGALLIFTSPNRAVVIPARAFASRRDARAFANRLAEALREQKRDSRIVDANIPA